MAVLLTILTDPRDPTPRRTLALPPNTSILKSAHAASIEITATCGGRGRCTSCRVKFVADTIPPPTIMDEIQLGNDLVREGYRLSCQCVPSEAVTVQVAPALEERAFQILGAGPGVVGMGRVTLDSGIRKQVVKVSLPREEHHQISDLEQLAAALGVSPTDVGLAVLQGLPAALRDDPAGVTVTTFAPPGGRGSERVVAVERGDTAGMKFGLAVDIGTTSVVSTLIELDSGEQLASVSSLNPQAARVCREGPPGAAGAPLAPRRGLGGRGCRRRPRGPPHRGGRRVSLRGGRGHQRGGLPGLARPPLGVLGAGRPGARGRADPP